jgi:hypothetical protein
VANRVKIIFPSNPTAFYLMSFSVFNVALGYSKWINKTFITGTPTAVNHIQIGATLADTMVNLLANLNANDLDGVSTFEASGTNGFYVNLSVAATWSFTNLTDPGSTITTLSTETITTLEPETLSALNYVHLSIRIFDTYVNERVLIEELASANACNIDWNGGDDLNKEFITSTCVFNMLVPEADDAHFIHLFSGDEQRYRVEVVGIDAEENEQLIWQGFLLPDQYNEPYQQVSFFVDFTASDMVASLKGKFLPPWYYQNKLPIAKVIAYCLEFTGLTQNMIVKPSVIPDGGLFLWDSIAIDMRDFISGEKYEDCFSILQKVLGSNLLSLTSYRGYWWLEGIHRKLEVETTNYQFDSAGVKIADIIVNKNVVDCAGSLQPTPNFTAQTPWRQVELTFKPNGSKNLFSDEIVRIPKEKQFYSNYKSVGYNLPVSAIFQYFGLVKLNNWIRNLTSDFLLPIFWNAFASEPFTQNYAYLYWRHSGSAGASDYNLNESAALNQYIECPEKPFLKPGLLYEFEFQFTVDGVNPAMSDSNFEENIEQGYYDRLVPFQIFINNIEKYSNRPSFSSTTNLRYEVDKINNGTGVYKLVFKLKFNFSSDVEGELKLRILMPIIQESSGGLDNMSFERVIVDLVKLTVIEGYNENEDLIAFRDINYTTVLKHDLSFSCSLDNSIKNSFAIGYPISDDYFLTIDRTSGNADFTGNHYFAPTVQLDLLYSTFNVNPVLIETLFGKGYRSAAFLQKVNGDQIHFPSLWFFLNTSNSKLAYLKSYEGFPVIPKNYKAYPDVEAEDVLKYMHVQYAPENYANRLKWRLYGSDVVDTYPKTIAKALHGVQPEMIYRLEAQALKLLFPDCLIDFYFDNQDRNFIPTTLKLDLFNGKTSFVANEAKFTELTDITYE